MENRLNHDNHFAGGISPYSTKAEFRLAASGAVGIYSLRGASPPTPIEVTCPSASDGSFHSVLSNIADLPWLRLHFNAVEVRLHHEGQRDVAAVVSVSTATRDTNEDVQEKLPPFTIPNV